MPDTTLALQYRQAIIEKQTTINEIIGGPEFWADGAVFGTSSEAQVCTTVYFVERMFGSEMGRHEVARVHFPLHWWVNTHARGLAFLRRSITRGLH